MMKRRKFIKQSLAYCSVTAVAFACKRYDHGSYYFFTKDEAPCIIALCEQIIPADKDPGATQAGVIHYIDRQLTGYHKPHQGTYRKGQAALQKYCKKQTRKLFEELNFNKQTWILKQLEQSKLPKEDWQGVNQAGFFNLVKRHTMEGFYSFPTHGGNMNYVSYRMMRIEYPYIVGQNRYKNI